MNPVSALLFRLRIAPGEGGALAAVAALFFCRAAAAVFFDTAAGTVFISTFGASRLPFIYIGGALAGMLLGVAYVGLAARVGVRRLLPGTLACAMAVAALAGWAVRFPPLVCAAMLWKEVAFNFLNIVVWGTASRLFDVRQGKRLFGLVAAGGIAANIVAGLAVPFLARQGGVAGLFFSSAAALAGGLVLLIGILRRFPEKFAAGPPQDGRKRGTDPTAKPGGGLGSSGFGWVLHALKGLRGLWEDRYLRLFLLLSVLSNFGFFFTDFLYFDRLGAMFQSEASLAAFMGRFSAWVGVGQLAVSLFLSGAIFRRFGLAAALAVLPWVCGIAVVGAVGTMSFLGLAAGGCWLIIVAKLADEAVRSSLLSPAFRMLYQPLPEEEQLVFQAQAESVIDPAGAGLAGGLLLLLALAWAIPVIWLCGLLAVFLIAWIGVARAMGGEYSRRLAWVLTQRRLSGAALTLDAAAVSLLRGMAGNEDPGVALHALSLLERADVPEWPALWAAALQHAAPAVRLWAVGRVGCRPGEGRPWREEVERLWREGGRGDAGVAAAALDASLRLGSPAALREVPGLWASGDPEARRRVLVALLGAGPGVEEEAQAEAQGRLRGLLRSGAAAERLNGVAVLAGLAAVPKAPKAPEGEGRKFLPLLLPLLSDPEREVRLAALRAAAEYRGAEGELIPALVAALVAALSDRICRPAAVLALHAWGGAAVGPLAAVANGGEGIDRDARRAALRLLGRMEGDKAAVKKAQETLRAAWMPSDEQDLASECRTLRQERLRALSRTGWVIPHAERALWLGHLTRAAAETREMVRRGAALASFPAVRGALDGEVREGRLHVLRLLSLFPGGRELCGLETVLVRHPGSVLPLHRARAVELLDTLLPVAQKEDVLALFDRMTEAEAEEKEAPRPLPLLLDLVKAPRSRILPWTRACALYEIGLSGLGLSSDDVDHLRKMAEGGAEEPFVEETARWTWGQTQPGTSLC